jgi:hypothetical protein
MLVGSVKMSGIRREGGIHSLNFYSEPFNICIQDLRIRAMDSVSRAAAEFWEAATRPIDNYLGGILLHW